MSWAFCPGYGLLGFGLRQIWKERRLDGKDRERKKGLSIIRLISGRKPTNFIWGRLRFSGGKNLNLKDIRLPLKRTSRQKALSQTFQPTLIQSSKSNAKQSINFSCRILFLNNLVSARDFRFVSNQPYIQYNQKVIARICSKNMLINELLNNKIDWLNPYGKRT